VGAAPQIASVTHALGYRFAWDPRLGQYAHIAAVAVVTPDGRLTRWLYGVAPAPEALHAAVAEAQRGQVGGLADRIRLLCYHYDPAIGRYSASVMTAVRVVGLLTLALLLAAIARLVVRERAGRRIG
jgi:protein SCO1/2